jgi:hypothetical protein
MGQRKIRNFGLIILNRGPLQEGPRCTDNGFEIKKGSLQTHDIHSFLENR